MNMTFIDEVNRQVSMNPENFNYYPVPSGYESFQQYCQAQHFVFFHNEGLYTMIFLALAYTLIHFAVFFLKNPELVKNLPSIKDSKISIDDILNSGFLILQFSGLLILSYIIYYFTMSYDALYPEMKNYCIAIVVIFIVGHTATFLYRLWKGGKSQE